MIIVAYADGVLWTMRAILQIDFDGTVVVGDASTGILSRFAGAEWTGRVNAASAQLALDPDSPALIDTMSAGFACLDDDVGPYLAYVRERHPARPGLAELIQAAEALGIEPHVVSNGFEFYIRDHLQAAGVDGRVGVHTGTGEGRTLAYSGPDGVAVRARFKERWVEHFGSSGAPVIYVGDGTSDIAAASRCAVVFARDSLLSGLKDDYEGVLLPFDTLLDVAHGLRSLRRD